MQTITGSGEQTAEGLWPVLTAAAMREADRLTIEQFGIPTFTLMESAGRAAADAIALRYGPLAGKHVSILCGKGNNGGDGLVVARVLYAHSAHVEVVLLSDEALTEETTHNLRLLRALEAADEADRLSIRVYDGGLPATPEAGLYVDALLGTGLSSDLREPIRGIVDWLNERPQPVVALDVPTGLNSDTGAVLGTAVRADLTVTMGSLKAGLLLGAGPGVSGGVEVAEIGIPLHLVEQAAKQWGPVYCTTDEAVRQWLPKRPHHAHKYSVGLALVVGGSDGFTGAPVMSSTAAARSGAGAVVCACPASVQPVLAMKMTEVMTLGLPVTDAGGIDGEKALDALPHRLGQARALLVGPGLGRNPDTQAFVQQLLRETTLPLVLDADGLNVLQGHTDLLREHANRQWILTPHTGEFTRLAGEDVDLSDRITIVRRYASEWNCVLLLKGMPSIIGCPDGRAFINGTGGPALATAGTGDVLSGICAGLLVQGLDPVRAAVCALHIGGAAADRYAAYVEGSTMMALDLLDQLPLVLHERFSH